VEAEELKEEGKRRLGESKGKNKTQTAEKPEGDDGVKEVGAKRKNFEDW
jgi:hypothetical protein